MDNKTHKTAVVIIPPEEVWPPIQAIRKEHDRQFRRWMPHITLLYPFRPREKFDAVAEKSASVCARIRPFAVRLETFRFFEHSGHSHTIWLVPEPSDAVIELQTKLWELAPDCDDVRAHPSGFTPHLSVGQARGKDTTMRLLAELQAGWMPVTFEASKVSLIWRNDPPDDVFRVERAIGLTEGVAQAGD